MPSTFIPVQHTTGIRVRVNVRVRVRLLFTVKVKVMQMQTMVSDIVGTLFEHRADDVTAVMILYAIHTSIHAS